MSNIFTKAPKKHHIKCPIFGTNLLRTLVGLTDPNPCFLVLHDLHYDLATSQSQGEQTGGGGFQAYEEGETLGRYCLERKRESGRERYRKIAKKRKTREKIYTKLKVIEERFLL